MKERNPMPIRKFSLIGLIALGLIIISLVGELFTFGNDIYTNIQTYVVLISQIIGNTLFGVALIGYFLHLKENKMLKWTSLVIGVFYIINLFAVNNLFGLFSDKFGLLNTFKDSTLLYVYSFFVSIALIIFGYAFTKLGKVNKAIGLFSILFVATSIYVTASNIFTTKVCSMLENVNVNIHDVLEHETMLASSGYVNIASYSCLFVVFLLLYINQRVVHTKTFKVKVEAPVEE